MMEVLQVLLIVIIGIIVAALALGVRWLFYWYLYMWRLAAARWPNPRQEGSGEEEITGEIRTLPAPLPIVLVVKDGNAILARETGDGQFEPITAVNNIPSEVFAEAKVIAGTRTNGVLRLGPLGVRWAREIALHN
jgi:hypothetical protein